MKKINVDQFSFLTFMDLDDSCKKHAVEAYRNSNYKIYIKNKAKMSFYKFCFTAFRPTIGNELDKLEDMFFIELFPVSGRSKEFQAFKKLDIQDCIPTLNKSFIEFINTEKEDLLKINSIVTEHHQRWKDMQTVDRIKLLDQLSLTYQTENKSNVYERYFVYENTFLNKKFTEYESSSNFEAWWNEAIKKILK